MILYIYCMTCRYIYIHIGKMLLEKYVCVRIYILHLNYPGFLNLYVYRQPSISDACISDGPTSVDSHNCRSKIFEEKKKKKNSRKLGKAKVKFAKCQQ